MSDELYLVAHKVRGAPAFDIAQHLTCPHCQATDDGCLACDGAGHWWIIPTSGHRAFPIMNWLVSDLCHFIHGCEWQPNVQTELGPIEASPEWAKLRDHYTTIAEAALDLTKALGLDKPLAPVAPILRRF